MKKAILIISHGSRFAKTKKEVNALAQRLSLSLKHIKVICAFLELETPSIPEGIDICVNDGAKEILIVQNFLNSGRHVDEDIPQIIASAQKKYSHIRITSAPPIGQHPGIDALFLDLIHNHLP